MLISSFCALLFFFFLIKNVSLSFFIFFLSLFLIIHLFLTALGLCCYAWALSSCREQGLLFVEVHRITEAQAIGSQASVVASPALEHRPTSRGASLIAQWVKSLPAMQETWVQFLGLEDPLEEEMATHSSILAWRIPWTVEPGGPRGRKKSDTTERLSTAQHGLSHFWACGIVPY